MTKRIVSGVFLLVALGALGLILAGALTSGEQLVVRFLTAIIVAALCLYVISDLRLQADDGAAPRPSPRRAPNDPARRRPRTAAALPPNSTAAFMATVTGKRSTTTADAASAADEADLDPDRSTDEAAATPTSHAPPTTATASDDEEGAEEAPAYAEQAADAAAWPHTAADPSALDEETAKDGLVAIFTKQAARETSEPDDEVEQHAMVVNDHYRPPQPPAPAGPNLTSIQGGAYVEPALGAGKREPLPVLAASGDVVDTTTDETADGETEVGDETEPGEEPNTVANDLVGLADPHANPEPIAADLDDRAGSTLGQLHRSPDPEAEGTAVATAGDEAPSDESSPGEPVAADLPVPVLQSLPATSSAVVIAPTLQPVPGLEAAAAARARVIELLAGDLTEDEIDAAIRSGEIEIITSLLDDGTLSAEGPISDGDVRTMVYVAFTSNELRKILRSGGLLDTDDVDLGPVEVFSTDATVADETDASAPPEASAATDTESGPAWAPVEPNAIVSTTTGRQEPVSAG